MRKILLLILAGMSLTSCATTAHFYQIATIASTQIRISDEGKFRYNNGGIDIEYNFWSEYGKFGFIVTNDTDNDIFIDLSRSFFIVNGLTFDYYQNRTYKSEMTCAPKSTIETKEKEGVWVPSHTSRHFCEFSLLDAPYRECGLPRYPSRKDNASVDFTNNTTPYAFENRIMVVNKGQERYLINSFYIQAITNIAESEAVGYEPLRDCSGNKTGETIKIFKQQANNRFYIKYDKDGHNPSISDDKINNSYQTKENMTSRRSFNFRDGIYGK